jgi:hypothetical protein
MDALSLCVPVGPFHESQGNADGNCAEKEKDRCWPSQSCHAEENARHIQA